ncbi:MAG: DUF481 domain-containing protein [Planctomycetota bacterium]
MTLSNGDRITGIIESTTEDKLTITSPVLGEIEVPLAEIANMVTGAPLALRTKAGETLRRDVAGIEGGSLVLVDPAAGPTGIGLALEDLEAINPPENEAAWTGSINLGLQLTDGNSERRSANASADAERRTKQDRISAKGAWNYSQERSTGDWNLTQRRLSGDLQYDYFLSDRLYLLAQTGAIGDTLANLDLRYTAGVGLGYQWLDGPPISFSTEAGVSYFSEHYRDGSPDMDTVAFRGAYSLVWEFNDDLKFLQDVVAFPGLEEIDDIYVTKDSRLQVSLTEAMFAQLQWLLNYDNTPAPGRERLDNLYLLSVGWSF